MTRKHSHYYKDVSNLETTDVYRVLALFNVTDPCLQHAVKKLLVAGGRGGGKDISKDVQEAIDTLLRWHEMRAEDARTSESFLETAILEAAALSGVGAENVVQFSKQNNCSIQQAFAQLLVESAKPKLQNFGGIGSGGDTVPVPPHKPVYLQHEESDPLSMPHCSHSMKLCTIPQVCGPQNLCAKPQG